MKDIHSVKWLEDLFFSDFNLEIIFILLFIIIIIFSYFYLKLIIKKRKYFKSKIKLLEQDIEKLSKTKFYEKLNKIFREYFISKWIKYSDKMTLKEIENFYNNLFIKIRIKKKILKIFRDTYMLEFSKSTDSTKKRREIITKILKDL